MSSLPFPSKSPAWTVVWSQAPQVVLVQEPTGSLKPPVGFARKVQILLLPSVYPWKTARSSRPSPLKSPVTGLSFDLDQPPAGRVIEGNGALKPPCTFEVNVQRVSLPS